MRALAHAARTAARAPLHLLLLALAALAAELALRWGITEALSSADPLPAVGAALLAVPLLATFAVACTATLARRSSLRDLLAAVARMPAAASAALLGVLLPVLALGALLVTLGVAAYQRFTAGASLGLALGAALGAAAALALLAAGALTLALALARIAHGPADQAETPLDGLRALGAAALALVADPLRAAARLGVLLLGALPFAAVWLGTSRALIAPLPAALPLHLVRALVAAAAIAITLETARRQQTESP